MEKYDKTTVYFSSYAKLPGELPSAHYNRNLDIGLIINWETGRIEGLSCTLITQDTKDFLKSIIIGYNVSNGIEPLIDEIKNRFFGSSQKALCVILKSIYEKYESYLEEKI
ncbi:hypothetical protein J2Z35_002253 [Acetoanaerobium pronyense]|uniref:DUF3870 domain-containing protein n=1 Tax=Acetoanaerobium pronyense TaxID=1482736 RepID=A0ABS4KKZ0_9FIRM|nr:hypothetical protein [Acetoanaerobium pronyense]